MVTRRGRWGCLVAIAVVPILWIWASGYLDGWNIVPPMRGLVVDGQTGEALAGARVWRWWVRDEVGGARLSPGGFNTGYPSASVEVTTDSHGQFKVGGLAALHAVTGMGLAVYMPGYGLDSFEQVGKLEYQGEGVRVWRKGWALRVEVRMKRLGRSPQAWTTHLTTINHLTQYGYPLPHDILLDEAYRYVSQSGKFTDGLLLTLDRWLPAGPPIAGPIRDERMRVLERSVLDFCVAHGEDSAFCRRRPHLIEYYSRSLGIEARGTKQ